MGGIATEEKLSQGMARFRQIEATWDREDTERWVLLRRLLPSLRTSFELPTAQRCVEELLRKADSLCVTTIATITEVPAELASAVHAGDRPAVNAIFKKYTGKSGSGKKQNKGQVCWYLDKFSDDSLCYSGPPTLPAVRSNLPQRTPCPAHGTFEPSTADPLPCPLYVRTFQNIDERCRERKGQSVIDIVSGSPLRGRLLGRQWSSGLRSAADTRGNLLKTSCLLQMDNASAHSADAWLASGSLTGSALTTSS